MGAAISALPRAVGIVKRNPILLLGAVVFGLIALVGVAVSIIPLIGTIILQVLILPVGLAGIVAMTDAGTAREDTSLGEFTGGISNYAGSMIGAYGLMFLIQAAAGIALLVVFVFVLGVGLFGAGMGTGSEPGAFLTSVGLLTGLVLLVVFLVFLVLGLIQQFLDVAVVVGGEDATGALSEATSLITGGPLRVLGYSILRFVVLGVAIGVRWCSRSSSRAPGSSRTPRRPWSRPSSCYSSRSRWAPRSDSLTTSPTTGSAGRRRPPPRRAPGAGTPTS